MCGIAGLLYRAAGGGPPPVGAGLMTMARCLQHRGTDSAGVAVFGASRSSARTLQVALPLDTLLPEPQTILALGRGALTDLRPERSGFTVSRRAAVAGEISDADLVCALEQALPGAAVTSLGQSLRVYKTVGLVEELMEQVTPLQGSHGIAHLRLATESRIDPAHAQPFWGRPYPDIAVTHNGHITNYHKLRQRFEVHGFTFASRNDSEIIGTYLGSKIGEGMSLAEALSSASVELDGSFSFIAATEQGLGVARDPFATKPLLFCETEAVVALASEPQALHRLLGDDIEIREIRPQEVRVWEKE